MKRQYVGVPGPALNKFSFRGRQTSRLEGRRNQTAGAPSRFHTESFTTKKGGDVEASNKNPFARPECIHPPRPVYIPRQENNRKKKTGTTLKKNTAITGALWIPLLVNILYLYIYIYINARKKVGLGVDDEGE